MVNAVEPKNRLVLAAFRAEEATRFGRGDLGSRLAFGLIDDRAAEQICDIDGRTLKESFSRHSLVADDRITPQWLKNANAFLEVHVEQGPVLDREGLSLGVVEGIAAFERYILAIVGEAAHSGTTDYLDCIHYFRWWNLKGGKRLRDFQW